MSLGGKIAKLDLGIVYRGNTLKGFNFKVFEGDVTLHPTGFCMWLVGNNGVLLHDYSSEIIVGSDGMIHIPDILTTTSYPLGTCRFDIKFSFPNGEVETFIVGSVVVRKGVSECQ